MSIIHIDYISKNVIILILGMGPTGLNIARAFGKLNFKVFGVGLNKYELGFSSKYVKKIGYVDPRTNNNKLLNLLKNLKKNNKKKQIVIYPAGDEYVEFLNKNYLILNKNYFFNQVRDIDFDTFLNKKKFYFFCKKNNIPTIKSFFPTSCKNAIEIADKIPYPCFIKPIYIHKWTTKHGFIKGFKCDKKAIYTHYINQLADEIDNIMVQEFIIGDDNQLPTCMSYVTKKGEIKDIFTARKIRQYPIQFGTATSVEKTNELQLIEYTKKIILYSGYKGFAEVEAKWCSIEKKYKVIEVNIRPCRLNGFLEGCGINIFYNSFLDIIGEKYLESNLNISNNYRWLFLHRDIFSIISLILKKRISFKDLIYSYKGKRVHCIWDKNDIKPTIFYFMELFIKTTKILFSK